MEATVCVVIAAKDAAQTVATAIASALAEPEVARVIVVDDASCDDTAEVARAAGAGTGRLSVIELPVNRGPANARNLAFEASDEPFLAILDADDVFLCGRFSRIFRHEDWDMIADNIAFVPDASIFDELDLQGELASDDAYRLTLEGFILGNLTRKNKRRGELGFLKPVMKRTFLAQRKIAYDARLRLGEDYDIYARMLAAGARFLVIRSCGYGAVVRSNSLSGRHSTDDLRLLAEIDRTLMLTPNLSAGEQQALHRHERQTRDRFRLRRFLDVRQQKGKLGALRELVSDPGSWLPVLTGVAADKFDLFPWKATLETSRSKVRYLFPISGNRPD